MGFENHKGGNYFTILGGKFCERVKEGTPNAIPRVNKNGKLVHEIFHDKFTGKLIGIKVQDAPEPIGKVWNFQFQDRGEVYSLQIPYAYSLAKTFLKILPNVDLTQEMTVAPSTKKDEKGKDKTTLFVNQNGNAVKHAYTRENPNGMPEMKQVKVKGVLVWDDTDQIDFLYETTMKNIVPKLGKKEEEVPVDDDDIDMSNIPF